MLLLHINNCIFLLIYSIQTIKTEDQAIKVERALAQAEAEEEYVRRHASEQMVRSWEEAKVEKTEREKYEKMQKDFDPKFCGPSSCQKMPGMEYDDPLPLMRAEQKRQFRLEQQNPHQYQKPQ